VAHLTLAPSVATASPQISQGIGVNRPINALEVEDAEGNVFVAGTMAFAAPPRRLVHRLSAKVTLF
jgi:hypothetical protein